MHKHILSLVFCLFVIQGVFAQNALYIGEDLMKAKRFEEAIPYLSKVAEKKNNAEAMYKLGICYLKLKDYEQAAVNFANAHRTDPQLAIAAYYYAQVLMSAEKYDDAKSIARKFLASSELNFNDIVASCDSSMLWIANPEDDYKIFPVNELNTEYSEFGLIDLEENYFLFSTNRPLEIIESNTVQGKNKFFKLVETKRNADGKLFSEATSFDMARKSKYHMATPIISQDGNTMIVSLSENNIQGADNIRNLDLYSCSREVGGWTDPKPLNINSNGYSSSHPYLSEDGNMLYFISNRPGGYGGYDIYRSKRNGEDWSKPENIGPNVNTAGNEFYPAIKYNKLYFSSEGHFGMGGLDIFESTISDDGLHYSTPKNLKSPLNSSKDDFAIYFKSNEEIPRGYFSSNREGGLGADDIYEFSFVESLSPIYLLSIKVVDGANPRKLGLSSASVSVTEPNTGLPANKMKIDDKRYFALNEGVQYRVKASKDGYLTTGLDIVPEKDLVKTDSVLLSSGYPKQYGYLTEPQEIVAQPKQLNRVYSLNNIYYELDKADLLDEAKNELDKLLIILRENPDISIQINSHCDSRGNDDYNLELSQRRAQSVVDYLLTRGITLGRLKAKGFGETKLLNKCSNGRKCSEAQHAFNRRTEFQIVGLGQ